jgi:glutathione S-transferase
VPSFFVDNVLQYDGDQQCIEIISSYDKIHYQQDVPIRYVHALLSLSVKTRLLTFHLSQSAQKVLLALDVANAPYQMDEIPVYGPDGKPDWFLELNPRGTVPVLICFGGAVRYSDSDVILDQIHKAVEGGKKLLPKDNATEARVGQFRGGLAEFLPIGKDAVLGGNVEKMWTKLKELDELIGGDGPYICGKDITVADCAGFPFLWRIDNEFGPVETQGCNNIRAWLDTCQENKIFANTIQPSWWWWW